MKLAITILFCAGFAFMALSADKNNQQEISTVSLNPPVVERSVKIVASSNQQVQQQYTLYWDASVWDDSDAVTIEYDVMSSSDLINWSLFARTTNTSVSIPISQPFQYFIVGAHGLNM